jgi:hypothetical protein
MCNCQTVYYIEHYMYNMIQVYMYNNILCYIAEYVVVSIFGHIVKSYRNYKCVIPVYKNMNVVNR